MQCLYILLTPETVQYCVGFFSTLPSFHRTVHDWFMTFRGQPLFCKKCDDAWHENGQCPKWESRNQDENEVQQRYVFFGTSMLRHCNDTKETRFDSVPSAKIGHSANHIENDVAILPHAEVIVVAPINNHKGGTF